MNRGERTKKVPLHAGCKRDVITAAIERKNIPRVKLEAEVKGRAFRF